MFNWFEEREFVLNEIKVRYQGADYYGKGFLNWSPEDGFRIKGFVERIEGQRSTQWVIGAVRAIRPSDYFKVQIKPYGFVSATSRLLGSVDPQTFVFDGTFDLSLPHLTFIEERHKRAKRDRLFSGALFSLSDDVLLPDVIRHRAAIGRVEIERGFSRHGLAFKNKKLQVTGRIEKENTFHIWWNFSKNHWRSREVWRIPDAMQTAFSYCSGQYVQLLKSEVTRGDYLYIDVHKKREAVSLGVLNPFGFDESFDKDTFLRLTEYVARRGSHADTIWRILSWVRAARSQSIQQAAELLLATGLEAALRTIYGIPKPSKKKDDKFDLKKTLVRFQQDYLDQNWRTVRKEVMDRQSRLRDRNAHPDWVEVKGGSLSSEGKQQALEDMMYLSRFYGYMALALAGFQNLEPKFHGDKKSKP